SSPGAYFVTLCTHGRACLFGFITNGVMHENALGAIVREEWFRSAQIRPDIQLEADEFVLMPNHLHGIIRIIETAARRPTPSKLSTVIAGFKAATTRRINELRGTPRAEVWQRNYYEHIIRTESGENELCRIREYIATNPARWELDRYYCAL
ncbi:MAG: transposase, partial [Thermoflexales bacterium]|nr:transposase [Thermoflexales bacterium]